MKRIEMVADLKVGDSVTIVMPGGETVYERVLIPDLNLVATLYGYTGPCTFSDSKEGTWPFHLITHINGEPLDGQSGSSDTGRGREDEDRGYNIERVDTTGQSEV